MESTSMTAISGSAAAVTGAGVLTNIVRNSRTSAAITDNTRRAQSIDRFDAVAKTTRHSASFSASRRTSHLRSYNPSSFRGVRSTS
jgi:aspartokinase-like uncharacterized kinase